MRTTFLALALFSGVAAASPRVAHADQSDLRTMLIGIWVRIETEANEASRVEAIDRAIADLPAVVRPIARGVMRRSVQPVHRFEIRPSTRGLLIQADSKPAVTAHLDGSLDRDPEAVVRSWAREDGFEQVWRTDDRTHGRTRWRLVEVGRCLSVTTRVEDARFSAPLVYVTLYERQGVGRSESMQCRARE